MSLRINKQKVEAEWPQSGSGGQIDHRSESGNRFTDDASMATDTSSTPSSKYKRSKLTVI